MLMMCPHKDQHFGVTYWQLRDDDLLDEVPDALVLQRALVLLTTCNGHADVAWVDLTAKLGAQVLADVNAPVTAAAAAD